MYQACKNNVVLTFSDLIWFDNLKDAGLKRVCLWQYRRKRPSSSGTQYVFFQYKNRLIGHGEFVKYQETSIAELFREYGHMCGVKSYQEMLGMLYAVKKQQAAQLDLEKEWICGAYILDNPSFYDPTEWMNSPYQGSRMLMYDEQQAIMLRSRRMA